ncbi:hypothetical protein OOZ19_21655 [Saccharopolyspora sp. NFXS83]|uniref:hypothetical protein n=1 Tax=Saccharopolyspora sp. NFXS83 TaxID=2993560 RepID=UPI00224A5B4B|nr:hypothetical protein [Saccharopolyspora sp. NFXS83]MCX2732852.1 hypothetical protein [Saccharopolyspora sp. NFXS83]
MTYYADVEFLSEVVPSMVERNADEFRRMHDLLSSTRPTVDRVRDETEWEGTGREQYDARLQEVAQLVDELAVGFDTACKALDGYAPELAEAQRLVQEGQLSEQKLSEEIGKVATALTRTAQEAEPMRQWEDISSTTGVLDWFAELGVDVDSIRDAAQRYYDQAGGKFGEAEQIESAARGTCLGQLNAAYEGLPDFRAQSADTAVILAGIAEVGSEAQQAAGDANVALPGGGPKTELETFNGTDAVSPTLQRFRDLAGTLPEGKNTPYWLSENSDEFREQWIGDNKAAIEAAARESGLPAELVAGIAWQEVGGKGRVWDDATGTARDLAEPDWSPISPENQPSRWRRRRDLLRPVVRAGPAQRRSARLRPRVADRRQAGRGHRRFRGPDDEHPDQRPARRRSQGAVRIR